MKLYDNFNTRMAYLDELGVDRSRAQSIAFYTIMIFLGLFAIIIGSAIIVTLTYAPEIYRAIVRSSVLKPIALGTGFVLMLGIIFTVAWSFLFVSRISKDA